MVVAWQTLTRTTHNARSSQVDNYVVEEKQQFQIRFPITYVVVFQHPSLTSLKVLGFANFWVVVFDWKVHLKLLSDMCLINKRPTYMSEEVVVEEAALLLLPPPFKYEEPSLEESFNCFRQQTTVRRTRDPIEMVTMSYFFVQVSHVW